MAHGRKFAARTKVPLDVLPEALQTRVGPEAPESARRIAARAMLPAEPAAMVCILAYLAGEPEQEISQEARRSLEALPEGILLPALQQRLPERVLEACAARFLENEAALEAITLNQATSDEAIAHVASLAHGRVLDMVAGNQVRLLRFPDIVEALYFNPRTPTGTAVRAIETAAREGIDLSHIPGYREIAASIMGGARAEAVVEPAAPDPEAEPTPEDAPAPEPMVEPPAPAAPAPAGIDDEMFETLAHLGEGQEMSDQLFDQLLRMASESESEGLGGEDLELRTSNALWHIVREMTLPQKVRLALMGNAAARAILVRDPKKMVCMAVLRSPGLNDREISDFAANKSLPDDVIRAIANRRDWLKNYQTRLSIVQNPKCPPVKALGLISSLRLKDLRKLSRDKEVPTYLTRQAKNLLAKRETRQDKS